jgi:hypothetical protein
MKKMAIPCGWLTDKKQGKKLPSTRQSQPSLAVTGRNVFISIENRRSP